jgi:hypothetical protein
VAVARERGLELVAWTIDTHDWRGDTADAMFGAAEPFLAAGEVVLAHDGVGPGAARKDAGATAALIGPLVHAARTRGLQPGPLDDAWPVTVPVGNPDFG